MKLRACVRACVGGSSAGASCCGGKPAFAGCAAACNLHTTTDITTTTITNNDTTSRYRIQDAACKVAGERSLLYTFGAGVAPDCVEGRTCAFMDWGLRFLELLALEFRDAPLACGCDEPPR